MMQRFFAYWVVSLVFAAIAGLFVGPILRSFGRVRGRSGGKVGHGVGIAPEAFRVPVFSGLKWVLTAYPYPYPW